MSAFTASVGTLGSSGRASIADTAARLRFAALPDVARPLVAGKGQSITILSVRAAEATEVGKTVVTTNQQPVVASQADVLEAVAAQLSLGREMLAKGYEGPLRPHD